MREEQKIGAEVLLGWRIRILRFTEAIAAEQEDLGVLDEPVGDRRGDGRIEENVAPVGERCVGGYDGRTLLTVVRRGSKTVGRGWLPSVTRCP